jgi:hypothetical protein
MEMNVHVQAGARSMDPGDAPVSTATDRDVAKPEAFAHSW